MIKIVAKTKFREDSIDEVKALVKELVEKSQAEEGNISYSFNQNIQDPSIMTMIEIWQDKAAIDAHNASEHFQRIFPQMGAFAAGKPEIDLYTEIEF